jgi:pimeloyl-ACP methyl ester carboxylesterase
MEITLVNPTRRPRAALFCDILVRGDRLRVARWRALRDSAAPPLLFFSGIGANIELLAPFLEELHGRDVITLDVPGIGGSAESRRPYRLSAMADAARQILTEFGCETVDVMGVSWGGMLAQEFAYRHPKHVNRLVLAATSPGMPMVPGKLSSLIRMVRPHRYTASGAIETFLESLYGGSSEGLGDYASRIRAPTLRGYFHQLLAIAGWTSLRKLTRISADTLILMGAQDRLVPPANGQMLKFLLRNARLEVLGGAGHLFLLTHRGDAVRRIERFLDYPEALTASAQRDARRLFAPTGSGAG